MAKKEGKEKLFILVGGKTETHEPFLWIIAGVKEVGEWDDDYRQYTDHDVECDN